MVLCMVQLQQSIWFDESYSAYLTRFEYPKLWELTAADVHPPFFYILLKTWAHFFGHTDFAMRMLSVLFGAIAIIFAFLWLKYKYGATAAITASTLLAISPVFIRYGQEMRMYTIILAIVFAATYVLQLAVDNGKKRWWAIYAILISLGMWTHYFCALAWIAHLVYLIKIYGKKIFQKKIIATYGAAVLMFAPWLPSLFVQITSVESGGFWIRDISAHGLMDYWTESLVYMTSDDAKGWIFLLLLFVSIIIFALAIKYRGKIRMLISLALVPVFVLILLSLPPLESMFNPRYILYSIVAIALIFGVSLVHYARDHRKKRSAKARRRQVAIVTASFLMFFGTSIVGIASVYATGNYNFDTYVKSPSKDLYNTITTIDGNQNLAIICASEWLYYDLSFYTTKEHSVYFLNETVDYKYGSLYPLRESAIGRIDNLDAFLAKRDYFWYITTVNDQGEFANTFPRDSWQIYEYSTVKLNDHSDTYAIVKMARK